MSKKNIVLEIWDGSIGGTRGRVYPHSQGAAAAEGLLQRQGAMQEHQPRRGRCLWRHNPGDMDSLLYSTEQQVNRTKLEKTLARSCCIYAERFETHTQK